METNTPGWNDLLFEKRNKLYGAYELRTNYSSRLFKSFIIMLSGSFLLFGLIYSTVKDRVEDLPVTSNDSIIFSSFFQFDEFKQQKSPEVFNRPAPIKPDERAFLPVSDSIPNSDDDDQTGNDEGLPLEGDSLAYAGGSENSNSSSSDLVLPTYSTASVDTLPEFPGGLNKFYDWLKKRIHYTEYARQAGLNKKTYVSFNVNEQGLISDIVIHSAIGFGIDEQIEDVLMKSPKWSPGIVRNTAVKTQMILPLSFRLAQ